MSALEVSRAFDGDGTTEVGGVTLRRIPEWDDAYAERLRGRRLELIRAGAERFRERFRAQGQVRAVRTIELASAPYPTKFAFHGAARAPLTPYIAMMNRLILVQYEDFAGELRTFAWEPTDPEGTAEAPFYEQLEQRAQKFPGPLAEAQRRLFNVEVHTMDEALAAAGLAADDVDAASFDHLHVQDPRLVVPHLPRATFLAQRAELDTFRSMHPMQWAWYVDGGMEGADLERWVELDGDYELGVGIAIIQTPGHTDGNHSLVLNTPSGIWVSSENGVAIDNWYPQHSRIPGVAASARFFRREVVPNANTLEDSIDQYDSMVKEKTIADPSPRDSRFGNVLPSTELCPWKRQWPVVPTLHQGGIEHGTLTARAGAAA